MSILAINNWYYAIKAASNALLLYALVERPNLQKVVSLSQSEDVSVVRCSQAPGITVAALVGNCVKVWGVFTGELIATVNADSVLSDQIRSFDIFHNKLAMAGKSSIVIYDVISFEVLHCIPIAADLLSFGHSIDQWALYLATRNGALIVEEDNPPIITRMCEDSQREACSYVTGSKRVAAVIRQNHLAIAEGGMPTVTYVWPGAYTKVMTSDGFTAALCTGEMHLFLHPSKAPMRIEADESGPLWLSEGRAWACYGLHVVTLP